MRGVGDKLLLAPECLLDRDQCTPGQEPGAPQREQEPHRPADDQDQRQQSKAGAVHVAARGEGRDAYAEKAAAGLLEDRGADEPEGDRYDREVDEIAQDGARGVFGSHEPGLIERLPQSHQQRTGCKRHHPDGLHVKCSFRKGLYR